MLTWDLALTLRDAGLTWTPTKGDVFVVPDLDLDEETFVLSDMVIEAMDVPGGETLLAFNGTTEWALDNLSATDALWVPREDQLRVRLGVDFVSLEHLTSPVDAYAVTLADGGRHVDVSPETAYARALLAVLTSGD